LDSEADVKAVKTYFADTALLNNSGDSSGVMSMVPFTLESGDARAPVIEARTRALDQNLGSMVGSRWVGKVDKRILVAISSFYGEMVHIQSLLSCDVVSGPSVR
jgi:hypothetical protein